MKELLRKITENSSFNEYQKIFNPSWNEDLQWFINSFKIHIASSDYLYEFLEDQHITWIDDLPLINTFLSKTFKQLIAKKFELLPFPEFIKSNEDVNSNPRHHGRLHELSKVIQRAVDFRRQDGW